MSRSILPEYKVVMLGSGGVGKSMITTKFINGNFSEDYDPTIEDSYRKQCNVDNAACVLDVLDTAGQEEYIGLRDYQIRSGNCFVLVYSIQSKETLEEVQIIADRIFQTKNTHEVPIVLVGNKSDCEDKRKVSQQEGRRVAKKIGSGFYETSAKTGVNVEEVFVQCVRRIKHHNKNLEPPSALTAASSFSSTSHSRQPSGQVDKRGVKEKPKTGAKGWLSGRKSLSKEKAASEANTPSTTTASPKVTAVLPNKATDSAIPDYYMSEFANQVERPTTAVNKKPTSIKRRKADSSSQSSPGRRTQLETSSAPPPTRKEYDFEALVAKRGADTRSAPPPPRQSQYNHIRHEQDIPSLKRSHGTDSDSDAGRRRIDIGSISGATLTHTGHAMNTDKELPQPYKRHKKRNASCLIL
ncbi:hypothetical protein H4R99_007782 [Coemansia sp. RSA 1722]|nr:hypothetical protein IWW45_002387 [Coemansia sp. RSA 485]KAJ2588485.1 hypothetical protein H4R99_007782 [Coemansia sp. RSA 1722]